MPRVKNLIGKRIRLRKQKYRQVAFDGVGIVEDVEGGWIFLKIEKIYEGDKDLVGKRLMVWKPVNKGEYIEEIE